MRVLVGEQAQLDLRVLVMAFLSDGQHRNLGQTFLLLFLFTALLVRMRLPIPLARLASPAPLRLLRAVSSMPPRYPGHIPLTLLEKVVLTAGSATAALLNPRRAGA